MKRMISLLALLLGVLLLGSCASRPVEAAVKEPAPEPDAPAPEPVATADMPELPDAPEAPEPDAAERRLASMTREEKVCQLLMLCSSDEDEVVQAAERGAGGLCLYAASFADKDKAAVLAMTEDLQARSPLPLLLAVDEEGGTVCRVSFNPRLRAVPFAAPRYLYAQGGWSLIESDTAEKAQLLRSLGLNVNLAPVADVPLSWQNYIYARSFSTDPAETAEYIRRVVTVMKQEGLGSTLKHFPGYGGSADTHTGQAYDRRPLESFEEGDFLPFIAGIEAGADAVLVSHNIVECMDPDYPASLSPMVHRILREELGFTGVILCDDLSMEAIGQFANGQNAAVTAALAGNDLLCCGDFEASAQALLDAVEDGVLPEEQLDASVLRILRWKLSLGLDLG